MAQIIDENSEIHPPENSAPPHSTPVADGISTAVAAAATPSPLPAQVQDLTDRARGYVEAASSANMRKAYASDWKHFTAWCRRQNLPPLPPDPHRRALHYRLRIRFSGTRRKGQQRLDHRTAAGCPRLELCPAWHAKLDRKDRAIATVMAGIRNRHAVPPRQKEAILPEDLIAMLEALDRGSLRGLRDRAMLLVGFAGGLRRSEITGLDPDREQTDDGRGWIEIFDKGALLTLRGKTGWREVEIGRGSSDATCPVAALKSWIKLAKGPSSGV